MRETKTLALVEAKATGDRDGTGSFEGYASVFGSVDSYGDTIAPGAYVDTLGDFLRDGFIAWGHDWLSPVAMPTAAREDARGLRITAVFHSHADAQRARTITAERLEAGKSMGLSIGYEALDVEYRTVDTPVRGAFGELTDKVRVLKRIKLFETSLVTVPAERLATVIEAKGHGLPFDEHSERVRVALAEWLERVKSGSDIRGKVGRPISEARRTRMASVSTQVRAAADEIDAMLEETATQPKGCDLDVLYGEFMRTQARLNGVPV